MLVKISIMSITVSMKLSMTFRIVHQCTTSVYKTYVLQHCTSITCWSVWICTDLWASVTDVLGSSAESQQWLLLLCQRLFFEKYHTSSVSLRLLFVLGCISKGAVLKVLNGPVCWGAVRMEQDPPTARAIMSSAANRQCTLRLWQQQCGFPLGLITERQRVQQIATSKGKDVTLRKRGESERIGQWERKEIMYGQLRGQIQIFFFQYKIKAGCCELNEY